MSWPTVYLIDHKGVIQARSLQDSMIEKLVAKDEVAV